MRILRWSTWDEAAERAREWWGRHGELVLFWAVACMLVAALWRLGNGLPELLLDPDGALDLRLRHREVHRWFAGLPVYGRVERGDYPPASYVILWPFLGWLALEPARWLWGLTSVAALGWLAFLFVRESRATGSLQALLVGLLPFSVYASVAALSLGQVTNHTLPMLLGGLLVLQRGPGRWGEDLLASGLLLAALMKPTLSAPFYWLVAFVPGRLRPLVLVFLGYATLTLFAVSFQDGPLLATLQGWVVEKPQALHGHANIHKLLAVAGLEAWMLPVSAGILLWLGWWVFRHRRGDYWILLGVSAMVSQLWIHHRLYDHALVLVSMITLFRLARPGPKPDGSDVVAGVLFALTWLTMHAPGSVLGSGGVRSAVMQSGQVLVWLAVLVFLLYLAPRDMNADVGRHLAT
jgi:hypothetical protein